MGKRDFAGKEKKKPRKDAKKITPMTVISAPPEVQVIKKGKQREGRRVEEEAE